MVVRKDSTHEHRLGLLHFLPQHHQSDTSDRAALRAGAGFASVAEGTVGRPWREWHLRHTNSLDEKSDVTQEKKGVH